MLALLVSVRVGGYYEYRDRHFYLYKMVRKMWQEEVVPISKIQNLLNAGYEVEVDSPDGWVGVNFFIDKGKWEEYRLLTDNGFEVKCNEDHLFKTAVGWLSAKEIVAVQNRNQQVQFATKEGISEGWIEQTGKLVDIVDINVNHDNHRYYTNNVESHNTGVGKSLFMCHVAAGALSQNFNVLYITLEMAEEKIAERIDANLLNVKLDDLANLPKDTYERKISRIKENIKGKLIIKEYPTASAGSIHFRTLLNELAIKKNFKPDLVFIDYLNICSSSRLKHGANVNSYSYIKAIAEELRGLAVEFKVPIVSATQTTRSGYTNTDPGLEDTSESFGLPATADFMFALITSEELEKLNHIMVKQLKNRYNDPTLNKRFVVGVDRSKMKLYDVEAAAQTTLADSGQELDRGGAYDKPKNKFSGIKV